MIDVKHLLDKGPKNGWDVSMQIVSKQQALKQKRKKNYLNTAESDSQCVLVLLWTLAKVYTWRNAALTLLSVFLLLPDHVLLSHTQDKTRRNLSVTVLTSSCHHVRDIV